MFGGENGPFAADLFNLLDSVCDAALGVFMRSEFGFPLKEGGTFGAIGGLFFWGTEVLDAGFCRAAVVEWFFIIEIGDIYIFVQEKFSLSQQFSFLEG